MDTCQQIWLSLNSSSEKYLSMSIVLSNRFISDFINLPVLKEFHSLLATFSKLIFEDLQLHKDFIKRIFTTTIFLNIYKWIFLSLFVSCEVFTHNKEQFCVDWFWSGTGQLAIGRTIGENLLLAKHFYSSKQPTDQPNNQTTNQPNN